MIYRETPPAIATIWRDTSNPERSPQFKARRTTHNRYTVDFDCIKDILDWHYTETRRQLGKAGVQHFLLQQRFYGSENKSRLIGTAIDNRGILRGLVDLRMRFAACEVGDTHGNHEVDVVPEFDFIEDVRNGPLIEFVTPEDLAEQIIPIYIPPLPR